jgi:hypothetical protein
MKECKQLPTITSENDFVQLEKVSKVNLRKTVKEPPFTIRIDGIGAIPRKDIFAIKAKSKQGKTQAATVLMAGILGDETMGITVAQPCKTKVIYIDTEQTEANTIIVGHRVHRMCGWPEESNNARFRVYNLRNWDWEQKLPFIEWLIESYKPTVVVIDGIADLLLNFNDVEKSAFCILKLMQIASKNGCTIGNVLHENKSKEDSNMKGHLGTLLLQKASDVFEVVKKGDIFTLSQTESRNKPVNNISWRMDDLGCIHRQDKDPKQITREVSEAKAAIWRQIFAKLNATEITHKEIVQAFMDVTSLKVSSAKAAVKKAVEQDFLCKTEDGKYTQN